MAVLSLGCPDVLLALFVFSGQDEYIPAHTQSSKIRQGQI